MLAGKIGSFPNRIYNEDLLEDYAETVCVVIIVPLPRTRYQIEEGIIATIVTMKIY